MKQLWNCQRYYEIFSFKKDGRYFALFLSFLAHGSILTLHLYAYFMMNWWSRHSIIGFGKNVILMDHTFLKSLFEFRARTNKKLFHYIYLCRFLFCNHLMFTHFAPFFSFIELSMREQKVYTFELFEKQHCISFYNYITMWIAKFCFAFNGYNLCLNGFLISRYENTHDFVIWFGLNLSSLRKKCILLVYC